MKQCTSCGQSKSPEDFYADISKADGRQSRCKKCSNATKAAYVDEHSEEVKAYQAKYRAEHAQQCKESQRLWRANNPDKVAERRLRNKEQIKAYRHEWYLKNKANKPTVENGAGI